MQHPGIRRNAVLSRPSWPAGSLCWRDCGPAVPGSPSLTAPSSRQTRNVASDATPRPCAAVMNACLSVWGVTALPMPEWRATLRTIRPVPRRSSRLPSAARNTGPPVRSPMARSIARAVRGASGMVTTLPPLRVTVSVRCPRSRPRCSASAPGGFGDPQPVQREQGDQRMLGRRADPGGAQQRAELVAVQRDSVRPVIHPRTADMRGR